MAAGRAVLVRGVLAVACRGGPGQGRRARAGGADADLAGVARPRGELLPDCLLRHQNTLSPAGSMRAQDRRASAGRTPGSTEPPAEWKIHCSHRCALRVSSLLPTARGTTRARRRYRAALTFLRHRPVRIRSICSNLRESAGWRLSFKTVSTVWVIPSELSGDIRHPKPSAYEIKPVSTLTRGVQRVRRGRPSWCAARSRSRAASGAHLV